MELDGIQLSLFILCRRHGTIGRGRNPPESRRHSCYIIKMTHPADGVRRDTLKQTRSFVYVHLRFSVLPHCGTSHLSPQHMRHQLSAVTKSQYRYAQFKQFRRAGGCTCLIAGPAGQDNPLGLHGLDFINLGLIGINFTVHVTFSDASSHQLVVLTAEINHQH